MKRGWRGPHKGFTRFDIKDFDVDMLVVDAGEFERLSRTGIHRANPTVVDKDKIFPSDEDTPDLTDLSDDVRPALKRNFRTYRGSPAR